MKLIALWQQTSRLIAIDIVVRTSDSEETQQKCIKAHEEEMELTEDRNELL